MPQSPKSVVKAASVLVACEYRVRRSERGSVGAAAGAAGTAGFAAATAAGAAVASPVAWEEVDAGVAACVGAAVRARAQLQGCRRQRARLATTRITATAAVPAHGSHGGVNRFPKTSVAALRTNGPVMR